jgi:hypothetical protein
MASFVSRAYCHVTKWWYARPASPNVPTATMTANAVPATDRPIVRSSAAAGDQSDANATARSTDAPMLAPKQ